ncbi:MAG: FAD-dependent oxidoreductase, partial [Pseudomonadota bacterium]|nr:FAD-dependent oxidoreductase [Pseudomonadota bacterium]
MSTPTTSSNTQKLIIVGNGMVGHHFAEQLVESGALAEFEVTMFGEERHRAYDRVHLSEYFSGRDAESLALCNADYYHTHGIQLRSGEAVTAIDREQQLVVTEQGHYAYDQLV